MNSNADEILSKTIRERREEQSKWLFECKHCFGKFPTKRDLEQHLSRKLFKCPFKDCLRKFTHRDELLCHQKICPGRVLNSNFDNYKIYQMIDIRHSRMPRSHCDLDLWVKYPYWVH